MGMEVELCPKAQLTAFFIPTFLHHSLVMAFPRLAGRCAARFGQVFDTMGRYHKEVHIHCNKPHADRERIRYKRRTTYKCDTVVSLERLPAFPLDSKTREERTIIKLYYISR